MVGESTPNYACIPGALERIHALAPRMRTVMVVRHPVARAVSHCWMQRRNGSEPLGLAAAVAAEPARMRRGGYEAWRHAYAARGRYAGQLRRARALFGADRVQVLTTDDLRPGSPALLRLPAWLDLDPALTPPFADRLNEGYWHEDPDPAALAALEASLADASAELHADTGIDFRAPWRRARRRRRMRTCRTATGGPTGSTRGPPRGPRRRTAAGPWAGA